MFKEALAFGYFLFMQRLNQMSKTSEKPIAKTLKRISSNLEKLNILNFYEKKVQNQVDQKYCAGDDLFKALTITPGMVQRL